MIQPNTTACLLALFAKPCINRTINIFNIKCSAGIIPLSIQVPQGTRKDKKTDRKKERKKEEKDQVIEKWYDGKNIETER